MFCGSPRKYVSGHENKGERPASRTLLNDSYDSLKHDPLSVECQTCSGCGHTVDIVERERRRIVLRKRCPSCGGAGSIDISRGPLTHPED